MLVGQGRCPNITHWIGTLSEASNDPTERVYILNHVAMWHHEWEHFSSHPLSSRLPVIQRARLAPPWYLVTIISLAIRLQCYKLRG